MKWEVNDKIPKNVNNEKKLNLKIKKKNEKKKKTKDKEQWIQK